MYELEAEILKIAEPDTTTTMLQLHVEVTTSKGRYEWKPQILGECMLWFTPNGAPCSTHLPYTEEATRFVTKEDTMKYILDHHKTGYEGNVI